MYLVIIIKVALKSLLANKMRSFLAVLGIIIGVAAVIAMLGIGAGAKSKVVGTIQAMGTDLLMVRPGMRGSGGVVTTTQQNLSVEDAAAVLGEVPDVLAVAPVVQRTAQVKYYENNATVSILGASSTYFSIRNFKLDRGRMFSDQEADRLARVAILGPTTVQNLLGADDPIGATVKVNGINFLVIGVTESKGDQGWFNPDDQVVVPYTTAMQLLFGLDHLREIDVQARPGVNLDNVQDGVTALLRTRHRIPPDSNNDFEISNQAEILATVSTVTQTFTVLLGTVAGISLIVGGIGIMNIMLVTVTERTREIGIRKAIGAKDRDILRQFLFEAVVMSCLGGVIGIIAGIGAAKTIGAFTEFNTVVMPQSVIMALSFSAGVGIFFGYYPARRAALLNPIEALRYE